MNIAHSITTMCDVYVNVTYVVYDNITYVVYDNVTCVVYDNMTYVVYDSVTYVGGCVCLINDCSSVVVVSSDTISSGDTPFTGSVW